MIYQQLPAVFNHLSSRDPTGSRDKKVRRKAVIFTLHFVDDASAIEAKAPNLKPFSPNKIIYTR